MKRNNSGFSMMELLAAIVVLGILMGIAIPTVMNIMQDQRNKTYVEDGIRLAANMEYKMRSDNMMPVPAEGSCIAMNLAYLDNNTFNEAPYEGEYDRLASFVIARRVDADADNEYAFYVRLIEKMEGGAYRGIDLLPVDNDAISSNGDRFLYMNNAKDSCVDNVGSNKAVSLTDYLSNPSSLASTVLYEYAISCDRLIIYAPDDTPVDTP